jgi:hypothetical protein
MTSVIQVTQDDIEHGIRADCYFCPVALALERTLGAVDVRVYDGSADWVIPPKWFAWKREFKWYSSILPQDVAVFVADFDAGAPVKPCSFVIRTADNDIRQIFAKSSKRTIARRPVAAWG